MAAEEQKTSPLEGRVAIVTGASRGIGKEIALHLARKGAKVVVNYSGNQQKAEEIASIINNSAQGNDLRAIAFKADVTNSSEVSRLFDKAEETFGRIHIVVNSAGVLDPKYPSLADTTEQDWDWVFNVNCKGTFLSSKEAAKRLVNGGGGRIINLSTSIVGSLKPGFAAYAATKAAVETMTRILAKELRGTKITANCVAPGPIATEMFFAGKSEAVIQASIMESPLERLGEVQDVAPLVAFLASDEGEWINAQVIRVNGGYA
eukprot:Gb_24632 [translate_table: standard]